MSATFRDLAQPFLDEGVLSPADVHTVGLVAPRFGETDGPRLLGLAFAVRAPRLGHAGVDLGRVAGQLDEERLLFAPARGLRRAAEAADDSEAEALADEGAPPTVAGLPWPDAATWQERTFTSPMVGGAKDRLLPFVRQELGAGAGTLLLTRRMFHEQERVAQAILARAQQPLPGSAALANLDGVLASLFPGEPAGETARAVRLAAEHCLALIIGGPGTGKTFSISRLLAALLAAAPAGKAPVIALAAPTGKAAVRMREAIREATAAGALPPLLVDEAVRAKLQELPAQTLHRLLGVRPDGSVRHGPDNPVQADVVVVDEVSMIDLANMRRLVEAVRPDARLILLGDRDQLASVEAGCVLADLVGEGAQGPLATRVEVFTRSRRFASAPDVSLVAACLQSYPGTLAGVPIEPAARVACAVAVLTGKIHADNEQHPAERVRWLGAPEADTEGARGRPSEAQLVELAEPYMAGFDTLLETGKVQVAGYAALLRTYLLPSGGYSAAVFEPTAQRALLDALERYRVLAVHRRGPLGVVGLEQQLARRVRAFLSPGQRPDGRRHWVGRPILVTENAYDVGLMNGDVGLVLPSREGAVAVFPGEGAGESAREVRAVALSRLPPHEGALAMTVHKAQGSQFERVALVLAGRPSPLQTRELVYTGVTRTRSQLVWLGGEAELRDALSRRVERASGLGALLG